MAAACDGVSMTGARRSGLVALAAVAGIGCRPAPPPSELPLHTRELPGVSLDLPDGTEKDPRRAVEYTSGRVLLASTARPGFVVSFLWEPGTLYDEEEWKMTSATLASAVGAKVVSSSAADVKIGGDLPYRHAAIQAPDVPGSLTVFPCGGRRMQLITLGAETNALHAHILASLRCHPDAAGEAALDDAPAVVELPPGWRKRKTDPGQLYFASDKESLLVHDLPGTPSTEAIEKMLPTLFEAALKAKVTMGPRRTETGPNGPRDVWTAQMVAGSEELDAIFSVWKCPELGKSLLAAHFRPRGSDGSAGLKLILAVRCKSPG